VEPQNAYERVRQATESVRKAGGNWFYKKVDSVLRGNTGREIDAMLDALDCEMAVLAPAFPDNGRIIKNGQLILTGVKDACFSAIKTIEGTSIKRCGHIAIEAVRGGSQTLTKALEHARRSGIRIALIDSETNQDLKLIAQTIEQLPKSIFPAGSAGLISQMSAFPDEYRLVDRQPLILAENSSTLVVIGTRHPVTSNQLAHLKKDRNMLFAAVDVLNLCGENLMARVNKALCSLSDSADKAVIIATTNRILDNTPVEGFLSNSDMFDSLIGEAVAMLAKEIFETRAINHIIVSGGATASTLFARLGVEKLELIGEHSPGVVTSRIQKGGKTLYLTTKSGGFGNEDVFTKLVGHLRK
jgi:uncharacterized protein YgbK (DUF1537 family)